jgi:signal transduction histidine kinase
MKTVSRSAITTVEKAKQENEEYREYVESWIHEMKTPLTACSLILENGGNTQKLRRELKRADNMTESILYYARTKSLEKDTIIRTFSVSDVIESSVKSQMTILIAAGISIEVKGDSIVSSDDKALGFIINQLLINSAKYCPGCHIKIAADNNIITYEDDGIGIPSNELARVTERGFTGTNGRRIGNSTGMGLYIVKELCKHLGITLSITSEVNRFTSFHLTFHSLTKL